MWTDSIRKYIDPKGFVTLNDQAVDGPGAGNLLMHTGLYYLALAQLPEVNRTSLIKPFTDIVTQCYVDKYPGLLWRSPYKIGDTQQHDDYILVCAASYFTNKQIAKDILAHGQSHGWVYDSKNPESGDISLLHDRFIGQVAFYFMSAGVPLSVYDSLFIALRALSLSLSKDGDANIHAYAFFKVGLDASPLVFTIPWLLSPLRKKMGQSFAPYLGLNHPLNEIDK
jgi:hypothetical protein